MQPDGIGIGLHSSNIEIACEERREAKDQETGQYLVVAGGRSWKVLKASITYFKADAGDEAVILAPKNAPSKWAAVENVIKKILNASSTP